MKLRTSLIALALSASAAASVQAQESSLDRILNTLVANAVAETSADIKRSMYQTIASTTYAFSLDQDQEPVVVVTIRDLPSPPDATEETE